MYVLFLSLVILSASAPDDYSSDGLRRAIEIDRILYKRDAVDNILKDDPEAKCRNGGIYAGGQCHCIHPHTGPTCQDFACVHGISVGQRFDPNSLFFSKPCICNEGWKGDLCQYHLTDRCNNRGEWKDAKCDCIGHFFGDECQYTSRCEFGAIKHGRCICNDAFEGDYCERIVCYHGYADVTNHSRSCVCPAKFKGVHCDSCAQKGPKILPYPKCVVDFVPSPKKSRKQNSQQTKSRILIIIGAISFLGLIALFMFALHALHQRKKNPEIEAVRLQQLAERQTMLTDAALRVDEDQCQVTITKKERKRSLTNPFKMSLRKSSNAERKNSVRREHSLTIDALPK